MVRIDAAAGDRLDRFQWKAEGGIHLDLLGFVRFPEGHCGTLHTHPFWELIYIGAGAGEFQAGADTLPCAAGDILLFSPGENHRFMAGAEAPLDMLYFGFSFDFLPADARTSPHPRSIPSGPFADLIRSELNDSLAGLRERHAVEMIRSRLLAVASRVIGFLILSDKHAKDVDAAVITSPIRLAKEFLLSDLKGRHGVPDLARRFCLSPQYFGEIFKRDTGMSVKEFQRECRMEMAMTLLRDGTLSVTEVAAEVGLEDLAYFSRLFKRKFGVPPRRARAQAIPARA